MPEEWNKRRRQTTCQGFGWPNSTAEVPIDQSSGSEKPGNAGVREGGQDFTRRRRPTARTQWQDVRCWNALDRITQRAKTHPEEVFNNLFSLLNYELLWYAFRRLKRGKTPGVDGTTVEEYEESLEASLRDLLGSPPPWSLSHSQPSLRKNIPKGNGKTRPLGIACVEDKLVQRAVVMVLEQNLRSRLS